jgi:hypothetical protein
LFFLLLLVFVPKLFPSLCLQKKEKKKSSGFLCLEGSMSFSLATKSDPNLVP